MHCRPKEHVGKFNSKTQKIREDSAFFKHILSHHGGRSKDKIFTEYFGVKILKAYQKSLECRGGDLYIQS